MQQYETEEAIWNAKRSQALADIKQSKKQFDGEADLRALGDPPEKPLTPLLVCPEPTFEGYCRLTAEGPAGARIVFGRRGKLHRRFRYVCRSAPQDCSEPF